MLSRFSEVKPTVGERIAHIHAWLQARWDVFVAACSDQSRKHGGVFARSGSGDTTDNEMSAAEI
jgi:hypothetical protein